MSKERENTVQRIRDARSQIGDVYNDLDSLVHQLQTARELPDDGPKTPGITLFVRNQIDRENTAIACDSLDRTVNYSIICHDYLTRLGLPIPDGDEAYLVHFQATIIRKVR